MRTSEYLIPDPTIRLMQSERPETDDNRPETVDIGVPGDPEEQERTIAELARDLRLPPDRPKKGRLRQKAWDRHYGPDINGREST